MKQKIIIAFLVLFLIISIVSAEDDINKKDYLFLNLKITNNINIIPEQVNYKVDYVRANFSFFPKNTYRQEVNEIRTEPEFEKEGDNYMMEWSKPTEKELSFYIDSDIRNYDKRIEITKKVDFPIEDLDIEYEPYLKSGGNIDITEDMEKKAYELSQGSDDLYEVIFNIADYINENVEYNLYYKDYNKKASWVFENKEGVCDEFSTLFIAMCRALKIPARFVSGIAYSNIAEIEGFGNHAWAEVYFPDYGWVPFDISYKQLGYIDTTHITTSHSDDSNVSSVVYSSRGMGFSMLADELSYDVSVESKGNQIKPMVDLNTNVFDDNVEFGSYNLISVEIINKKPFYVIERVYLNPTEGLSYPEGKEKFVLLEPYGLKKVYWIVRVSDDLKEGYIYTFPVEAKTTTNATDEIKFTVQENSKYYSLPYINSLINDKDEKENKPYSDNVTLVCNVSDVVVSVNKTISINCIIENKGNVELKSVKICMDDKSCSYVNLNPDEKKPLDFRKTYYSSGIKSLTLKAFNNKIIKTQYFSVKVVGCPKIEIKEFVYPSEMEYGEKGEISFNLVPLKNSLAGNVKVEIIHDIINEGWVFESVSETKIFKFIINSNDLKPVNNKFILKVSYEDYEGNNYETSEQFEISLKNLTNSEKMILWLNWGGYKVYNFFTGLVDKLE